MLTWGKLLLSLSSLLSLVLAWLREKALIKAGEDKATVEVVRGQNEQIAVAVEKREEARADIARKPPASSLPDDGFRRD